MLVMLYQFAVKEGRKKEFVDAWTEHTEYLKRKFGTLGSRLHHAENGGWIAYAQWPNREAWESIGKQSVESPARERMMEAIESIEITGPLTVVRDLLENG